MNLGTLTPEAIEDLLSRNVVAHLGCHADGETYVVPISYAYHEGRLIGHTIEGKKTRMMRSNPKVCVEVTEVDDMTHWRSVICQGEFEELHAAESVSAMGILIDRLMPLADEDDPHGRSVTPDKLDGEGFRAVVYCIRFGEKTGRFQDG